MTHGQTINEGCVYSNRVEDIIAVMELMSAEKHATRSYTADCIYTITQTSPIKFFSVLIITV